jgi:hypothetical protein
MANFNQITSTVDAVNTLLASAGELPLNSIEDDSSILAVQALNTLKETHVRVLSHGWSFNTEVDVEIAPDINGEINLPSDVIELDTNDYYKDIDPVVRGQRIFSRKNNSYVFDAPIKVKLVRLLPFEDIPQYARTYITIRSARLFVARHVGDNATYQYSAQDETDALQIMKKAELRMQDNNILRHPEVYRSLQRRV